MHVARVQCIPLVSPPQPPPCYSTFPPPQSQLSAVQTHIHTHTHTHTVTHTHTHRHTHIYTHTHTHTKHTHTQPHTHPHTQRHTQTNAYLILADHSHAAAPSSIRCFKDDGKAIGLGKLLRLFHRGDGGIRTGHHGQTCTPTNEHTHTHTRTHTHTHSRLLPSHAIPDF